jgi:hypothetical protein
MKQTSTSLFLLLALLILFSCQPKGVVKQDESARVDSTFYYEHEDIRDPFIDTVFQKPDTQLVLKKDLYPPPQIKPKFVEAEGFRVQIFAGIDTFNADAAFSEAKSLVNDPVYLLHDKGLLKVQVGDYQYRYEADNTRDMFRKHNYAGAWVIQRTINVPIDSSAVNQPVPVAAGGSAAAVPEKQTADSGKYKIQVLATASQERARTLSGDLKNQLGYKAFYEVSGDLYKVYVGYFNDEAQARTALMEIRAGGYPDAWLVY